jgi:hypothetical protein
MKMRAQKRAEELLHHINTVVISSMHEERAALKLPNECDLFCLVADCCLDMEYDHPIYSAFQAFASLEELRKFETVTPRLKIYSLADHESIMAILTDQFSEGQNDTSFYDLHREDASLLWITHYR